MACYLRIQLKLGGIADDPEGLCDAQEWAWAQMQSLEQALSSTGSTPKRLEALVEVCAAALSQQLAQEWSRHADEASSSSQGRICRPPTFTPSSPAPAMPRARFRWAGPASKRRRMGGGGSIQPGKCTVPAGWAVLSALLYSYGFRLEQEQLEVGSSCLADAGQVTAESARG